MSSERFSMLSKKVASDISHFMKLAKKRLGAKTESEAMRMILRGDVKDIDTARWLEEAQEIAEKYGETES